MPSTETRYLAFSGGGFNTHSMLAGMVAGVMDSFTATQRIRDLDLLMRHVDGVSSNSGGSWFLSQLAYSDQFKSQFESPRLTDNYNVNGYNGQIDNLWKGLSPDPSFTDSIKEYFPTSSIIFSWINLISEYGFDWHSFNDYFTYQPFNNYPMHDELYSLTLSSERLPWANDKDLVTAAAVQTEPVVLNEYGWLNDKVFASVQPSNLKPKAQASPLGLVSDYDEVLGESIGIAKIYSGQGVIEYTTNEFSPQYATTPLKAKYDANDLGVIDAAIASSSAAALLAAPTTFKNVSSLLVSPMRNELAERYRNLAPWSSFNNKGDGTFDIRRSVLSSEDIDNDFQRFSRDGYTRLADGGYVDNTSAAFMLNHLQNENRESNFHMTIFANTSSKPSIQMKIDNDGLKSKNFALTTDVASLFGNSDGNNSDGEIIEPNFFGVPLNVPSSKIFDSDAWIGVDEPTWSFSKDNFKIDHFSLEVTTVDNKSFDIKGGQSGVVDIYLASNTDGFAAPIKSSHLAAYADNYSFYRQAISEGGGFEHLIKSFGVQSHDVNKYDEISRKLLLRDALSLSSTPSTSSPSSKSFKSRKIENIKLFGTNEDDIIRHNSGKLVARGKLGEDIHLLFSKQNYSGGHHSVIKDFSDEDTLLLDRKSFGNKPSFENAETREMHSKLIRSDVDFIYRLSDRKNGNGFVGQLFYNQNGKDAGFGDGGGLLAKFTGVEILELNIDQIFYF